MWYSKHDSQTLDTHLTPRRVSPGTIPFAPGMDRESGKKKNDMKDDKKDDKKDDAPKHTGAMIAFFLPKPQARKLVRKDADFPEGSNASPVSEMHMTLAYLGKIADLGNKAEVVKALKGFASTQPKLSGKISGVGRFNNDEGDGTEAVYASFDSPALPIFRHELIKALQDAGVNPFLNHGFTPHVTLGYVPCASEFSLPRISSGDVEFGEIVLTWGGEHTEFPLGKKPSKK